MENPHPRFLSKDRVWQGSDKICEFQGVKRAVLRDWSAVANVFSTLQIHCLLFSMLLNNRGRGLWALLLQPWAPSLALLCFYPFHNAVNSPLTNSGVIPLSCTEPGCSAFCFHGFTGSYCHLPFSDTWFAGSDCPQSRGKKRKTVWFSPPVSGGTWLTE